MKKKVLKYVVGLVLAIACLAASQANAITINAANSVDDFYLSGRLTDEDGYEELCVGEYVYAEAGVYYKDGSLVDPYSYEYISDYVMSEALFEVMGTGDLYYYSSYDTPGAYDAVWFSGSIPQEAFGKYVYYVLGAYVQDGSNTQTVIGDIRSRDPITSFAGTDNLTFCDNGDGKTVSLYSIWKCDKANIPSKVTIGNKVYKVTGVANNALEYKNITSLTIPSTVTSIGKEAFADASKLKTITINSTLKKVGENAFSGINKKATIKIKASKENYDKIVKLIKKAGAPKTVTFKRITK